MKKPKLRLLLLPFVILGQVAISIAFVVTVIVFFSGYLITGGYASSMFGNLIEWLADLVGRSPNIDWYFDDIG